MRFKGWIEVVLSYNIDASTLLEAEIEVRSAVNRIKNQGKLIGSPDIIDWGVELENQETES